MKLYTAPLALLALVIASPAFAQTAPSLATVVSACGTPPSTYTAGQQRPVLQNTSGIQCTGGTGGSSSPISSIGVYKNVSVIPTVQNAAYSAGQSIGGLQTLTGLSSGLLQQVQIASKGGSIVGVWVYVWNKSPAATTCTDRTNFAVSQADNQNLISTPFLLSPTLGVSSNDVTTYAQNANMAAPFVNNDSSPGSSIYVCLLASAAVTPATTTDYRLNLQLAQ